MICQNQSLSECRENDSDCILTGKSVRRTLIRRKAGKFLNYQKGDRVFVAGKPVVGFYVVCEGLIKEAARRNGEEITLSIFEQGALLTGDALFRRQEWHETTASALSKAKVLFLQKELIPQLMRVAGSKIGKKLAQNVKGLRRRLELCSCSVLENTAYWLTELLSDSSRSFRMSNKELADIVGCSPVTISRKLGKLSGEGVIEKDGQEITVLEREELREKGLSSDLP